VLGREPDRTREPLASGLATVDSHPVDRRIRDPELADAEELVPLALPHLVDAPAARREHLDAEVGRAADPVVGVPSDATALGADVEQVGLKDVVPTR
jgi:hypothetical protein